MSDSTTQPDERLARELPNCGKRFEPENGNIECWLCGRLLHAECLQDICQFCGGMGEVRRFADRIDCIICKGSGIETVSELSEHIAELRKIRSEKGHMSDHFYMAAGLTFAAHQDEIERALQSPAPAEREAWQPIAGAPINRTVIVGKAGTKLRVAARIMGPISGWRHAHSPESICFEPTHYQEMPPSVPADHLPQREAEDDG